MARAPPLKYNRGMNSPATSDPALATQRPDDAALHALFAALPVAEIDATKNLIALSPTFRSLHGLANDVRDFPSLQNSLDAGAMDPADAGQAQLSATLRSGCPKTHTHQLRDGRYVRIQFIPLGGNRLLRIDTDVTEEQLLQRRIGAAVQAIRGLLYDYDVASDQVVRLGDSSALLGYQLAEMPPDATWWRSQIEPADFLLIEENTCTAIAAKAAAVSNEYRFRHREGRWIWLWDNALLEYSEDGALKGMIGCTLGISERKQAEAHVEFLMQELIHRAKNLLAVVQAVANHAARDDERGAPFVQRFTQRLSALAACHDLLVRNHWRGADMAELANSQFAPFADLIGRRIHFSGPLLVLCPTAAQAIGMALHELATNAGKYGALSGDVGEVCLTWRLEGEEVCTCWRERGGPPVNQPEQTGFGYRVTVQMVEMAVGGVVTLNYAADGLTWSLRAAAARMLAP